MSTTKYTLLNEAKGCDQGLPVNEIVEHVTFGRIFPIQVGTAGDPFVIPLPVASPALASYVAALKNKSGKGDSSGAHLLSKKWEVEVTPYKPPRQVNITNLEQLLTDRTVAIDGKQLGVNLTQDDMANLLEGNPVRTFAIRTSDQGKEQIDLRATKASAEKMPMTVEMTPEQMLSAVSVGKVFIPGVGEHSIKLEAKHLRQFNATGMAVAKSASAGAPSIVLMKRRTDLIQESSTGTIPPVPSRIGMTGNIGSVYRDILNVKDWLNTINYPLAVYIPYTQEWELLGYSRGSLVNSFALAPQEELTLETYTWDRTKNSTESDFSTESESLSELTTTAKSSFEAIQETKKNEKWNASLHADISLPATAVTAGKSLGGTMGSESTIDKLNKQTVSDIHEAVAKTSNRLKATRQVKISEAKEVGSENRSKRFIRNPNMCHTLHFDYFEVLENYKVTTASDAAKAKLCVIMDIPIRIETINNAYGLVAYEGVLRGQVPKYFEKAFDAAHKLVAFNHYCHFKCMPKCACGPKPAQGQTTVDDPKISLREAAKRFIGSVIALRDAGLGELDAVMVRDLESRIPLTPLYTPPPPPTEEEWSSAKTNAFRALYKLVVMEGFAARYWSECLRFAGSYEHKTVEEIDIADCEIMIGAADAQAIDVLNVINALNLFGIKTAINAVELAVAYPLAIAWLITHGAFDNAGMDLAFGAMKAALEPVKAAQQKAGTDPKDPVDNSQTDAVASDLANASVEVLALIRFIQLNASHYKLLIWNGLDELDKIRLLMGMENAPQYLLPNILGIVGDKIAVEFNTASDAEAVKWLANFVKGLSDSEEKEVALPSPGISMQTRLGQCGACESFIVESRTIELQRLQAIADQHSSEAKRMELRREDNKDYSDPLSRNPSISVTLDKSIDKPA